MSEGQEFRLVRRTPQEQINWLINEVAFLMARVQTLEKRLDKVESRKSGGRPAKKIVVTAVGVCGIDPDRDSSTCEDASLYRRRQGCQGTACAAKATEYFANYRSQHD